MVRYKMLPFCLMVSLSLFLLPRGVTSFVPAIVWCRLLPFGLRVVTFRLPAIPCRLWPQIQEEGYADVLHHMRLRHLPAVSLPCISLPHVRAAHDPNHPAPRCDEQARKVDLAPSATSSSTAGPSSAVSSVGSPTVSFVNTVFSSALGDGHGDPSQGGGVEDVSDSPERLMLLNAIKALVNLTNGSLAACKQLVGSGLDVVGRIVGKEFEANENRGGLPLHYDTMLMTLGLLANCLELCPKAQARRNPPIPTDSSSAPTSTMITTTTTTTTTTSTTTMVEEECKSGNYQMISCTLGMVPDVPRSLPVAPSV